MNLWVDPDYRKIFPSEGLFERVMTLQGEVFRRGQGRETLRFEASGQHFFLKRHTGVGWGEIIKNLLQLRLPVLGALNEWRAIERLQILNIPTLEPVAAGSRGWNPATRQSFLITREMQDTVSLEDLEQSWREQPAPLGFKREIISRVADIARRMHLSGINHRDLYICHLYLSRAWMNYRLGEPEILVIDLHRAQIRRQVPERWLVKDVASLYFSSMDAGLTKRDYLRFMRQYRGRPLRKILTEEADFWAAVSERAAQLYATRPEKVAATADQVQETVTAYFSQEQETADARPANEQPEQIEDAAGAQEGAVSDLFDMPFEADDPESAPEPQTGDAQASGPDTDLAPAKEAALSKDEAAELFEMPFETDETPTDEQGSTEDEQRRQDASTADADSSGQAGDESADTVDRDSEGATKDAEAVDLFDMPFESDDAEDDGNARKDD